MLLRGGSRDTEVLMGRRSGRTRFMPDVYVFPGGRVDLADVRPSGFAESLPACPAGLDRATGRRLPAFARAALRETFEETGLLLTRGADGRPEDAGVGGERSVWSAYHRARLAPAFDALHLVVRAITPTDSPIRFHTRFFRADGRLARGALDGNGELLDLRWVPVGEVSRLPVVDITELVLKEALAQREAGGGRAAALYTWPRRAEAPLRWSGKAGRGP